MIWNLVQNSSWYPHVSRIADHHHVRIRPARVKPALYADACTEHVGSACSTTYLAVPVHKLCGRCTPRQSVMEVSSPS
ncbi:hypothetical protein N9A45_00785 [bacterium]|nr:hypothetical protein [bacterium]